MHNASCVLGVGGLVLFMVTILGLGAAPLSVKTTLVEVSLIATFYGLYFGLISRDFAEVCTNKMASQIGVSSVSFRKNGVIDKLLRMLLPVDLIHTYFLF